MNQDQNSYQHKSTEPEFRPTEKSSKKWLRKIIIVILIVVFGVAGYMWVIFEQGGSYIGGKDEMMKMCERVGGVVTLLCPVCQGEKCPSCDEQCVCPEKSIWQVEKGCVYEPYPDTQMLCERTGGNYTIVSLCPINAKCKQISPCNCPDGTTFGPQGCRDEFIVQVDPSDQVCVSDSDCERVGTDCSDCSCGAAVHKDYASKYEEQNGILCRDYQGGVCEFYCDTPYPRCIDNRCILSAVEPDVLYEKRASWGPCPLPDIKCFQATTLHQSGLLVLEGDREDTLQATGSQIESVKAAIEESGIMSTDCKAELSVDYWVTHKLFLNGQEKVVNFPACEEELAVIDNAVQAIIDQPESAAPISLPVAQISYEGGLCQYGICTYYHTIYPDGSATLLEGGVESILEAGFHPLDNIRQLQELIDAADFESMQYDLFTGACPTAHDGLTYTYVFYASDGTVHTINDCTVNVDITQQLFAQVYSIIGLPD